MNEDLDLIPVLNFFVVLVPLLLLSLSFSNFTTTEITLAQIEEKKTDTRRESKELETQTKEIQATLAISKKGIFVKVFKSSFQEGVSGASKRFDLSETEALSSYLGKLEREKAKLTEVLVKAGEQVEYKYVVQTVERLRSDLQSTKLRYLSGGVGL